MRLIFQVFLVFGLAGVGLAQSSLDSIGQYIKIDDFKSEFIVRAEIEIWIPENYENLDSITVLYMLDGQNAFHSITTFDNKKNDGWNVDFKIDSLVRTGTIEPVMVVGIFSHETRMSDYMPCQPEGLIRSRIGSSINAWYHTLKTNPPNSDQYLKFITKELKPFIDENYRSKKSSSSTAIMGSSMGGLLALYAICEYPEIFGSAACMSTHWPILEGVFTEYVKDNLPNPTNHKIYFDHGTEGLDSTYEVYQIFIDKCVDEAGYLRKVNLMSEKHEGADHNEDAWRSRVHVPLSFLF